METAARTGTGDAASAPPSAAPSTGSTRRPGLLALAVGLAVALGVLSRTWTSSALWLDEALSVNIAVLPLAELPAALRQDGAPPVYYVLLHGWTAVFGTSDAAVRSLSVVAGLLALPAAYAAGARLHSPAAGRAALLLLAANPFAVRYAVEARMYALVLLLVLLGVLALHAALEAPTLRTLLPLTGLATLLALTHYWALFLLAVVGLGLLVAAVRGPRAPAARRCLLALGAAAVLFLPWLPTFLFQSARTGTPWARPPSWEQVLATWEGWSGPGLPGAVLGLLLLVLALLAPLARPGRSADGAYGLLLRLPPSRLALALTGAAVGTLVLGVGTTIATSSGYALRYSTVALAPALLAVAVGLQALPRRAQAVLLATAVVLGLASAVRLPFDDTRTQARETAAALAARLGPQDLVLYCPDQLGPAVARLLPPGTDQLVYPSGGRPERIDWVDYAERNAAGDPRRYAALADRRAQGAVWLVRADGYRTFGTHCRALDQQLEALRGGRTVVQERDPRYDEDMALVRYPAPR